MFSVLLLRRSRLVVSYMQINLLRCAMWCSIPSKGLSAPGSFSHKTPASFDSSCKRHVLDLWWCPQKRFLHRLISRYKLGSVGRLSFLLKL